MFSNFYSYRNRNERDEDVLVGSREDLWRREPDGRLVLAKRVITPHLVGAAQQEPQRVPVTVSTCWG
ncbi:MAG: aromatic-ring-hydroxylating dioxygenase subunit beta [Pseudonocardia sp.]